MVIKVAIAIVLVSPPLLVLLGIGLLDLPKLALQRPGRLLLVIDHETVRQIEEVAGVPLHHALHLLRPQRHDGRPALALAPMLPPRPQRGESQLNGVLIGIGAEPRRQNGLHEGVDEARSRQRFVGVLAARMLRLVGVVVVVFGAVGFAPVLFALDGDAGVVFDGVEQRVELGGRL